ncbi:Leucine-rich repeat-containing protein 61 [Lamellibrachia satsuma]|nr:Leucine-rich repeat-containing protein 61 [Lamellibrachia satsuma]
MEITEKQDHKITQQMLKSRSGEFDIESIHTLALPGMGIKDLGCLGECIGLERLNLSHNALTRMYVLASLNNLMHLNLAANRISSLDGLQTLDNLQSVNLAGNLISSTDSLRCFTLLEKFTDLRLHDVVQHQTNPLCRNNLYKSDVVSLLPKLVKLDGERMIGKGSEIYKICEEIDILFEAQQQLPNIELPGLKSMVPQGFWERHGEDTVETMDAIHLEGELQDLLNECDKLQQEAGDQIQTAIWQVFPRT